MSSQTPGPAGQGPEWGPQPPEVERLDGPAEPDRARRGRRWGIAAVATVGVLGVAGAGTWAATTLMGGGPGAAQAVPADALGYVALDLDPGAGQKVEAYRFLRAFPALEDRLGEGEDLRRSLVEAILTEAPCEDLSFADDIDPWLGDRVAFAVRAGASADADPVPFFVVQVEDEAKARAGVDAIGACDGDGGEDPGLAFTGDYMVLAEDDATARQVADDAEADALADDDGFARWVDEAGGAGVLTGYAAADAPRAFYDWAQAQETPLEDELGGAATSQEAQEQVDQALKDFEGAAMALRFEDGGVVLETAASATGAALSGSSTDSGLTQLPATTVAALGFGVQDDAVDQVLEQLRGVVGDDEVDKALAEAEAQTGLSLPEDLQTLLGDGLSVALDSSVDPSKVEQSGGTDLPAGIRITGDPDAIVPVLEKLVAAAGAEGQVVIEPGDGAVAVGLSREYVAELAGDGDLGEQDGFRKALPDLGDSAGGLFVDFDTDGWMDRLLEAESEDQEVRDNLAPLDSLGVTGSLDGDVMRAWVRLSTD